MKDREYINLIKGDYSDINYVDGFIKNRTLSTKYISVYSKGNQIVLVNRGTTDAIQSSAVIKYLSTNNAQYIQDSIKEIENILQNIPVGTKIYIIGHSLGGLVSAKSLNNQYINQRINYVHTFNALGSRTDRDYKNTGKITKHLTIGDITGALSFRPGKAKYYFPIIGGTTLQTFLDTHSINSF